MIAHEQNVLRQFDSRADAYLTSSVHADGPDLVEARRIVEAIAARDSRALDVGCGAGHLGFAMAPLVAQVTVCDPAPAMLATASRAARERGIDNLEAVLASAASLPFADASFDLVASRYSAHHWLDVPAALREMRRVVRPGGHLLIIDVLGDESPVADTHLQAMELLRDPSHVRNHDARQWRAMLGDAGFVLAQEGRWRVRLQFDAWVARMNTRPQFITAIRALQQASPAEVCSRLELEADGSFSPDVGLFLARAV